jgi:hypothetical protein
MAEKTTAMTVTVQVPAFAVEPGMEVKRPDSGRYLRILNVSSAATDASVIRRLEAMVDLAYIGDWSSVKREAFYLEKDCDFMRSSRDGGDWLCLEGGRGWFYVQRDRLLTVRHP